MNRYESILLDKMVALNKHNKMTGVDDGFCCRAYAVGVLIDCITEFREPPKETPVEDGCGAMVKAVEK